MRSYALASMEDVTLWHERDISHSSVERVIAPDATILLDFMLSRFTDLTKNLLVYSGKDDGQSQYDQGIGVFTDGVVKIY